MQKSVLRKQARNVLACSPLDAHLEQNVVQIPEFRDAQYVLCYLSFGKEVPTRGIISAAWDAGKTVAIPRCEEGPRRLDWHVIHGFDGLVSSSFGIEEPAPDQGTLLNCNTGEPSAAIVPGLIFDEQGFRLGYGGGYYDRFLSAFAGTTIGVCRESQMRKSLYDLGVIEPHDIPVDIVVTENQIIYTKL